MKNQRSEVANDFIKAIGGNPKQGFKAHVLLPCGNIGITSEYVEPQIFEWVKAEIVKTGGKIIKIEIINHS
jgi:hypothetical protein